MNTQRATTQLRPADRARLRWLSARYGFWLDLQCVPRRSRRALCTELEANVTDAAREPGGVQDAIERLGSLRVLARETATDAQLRSRWLAGSTVALAGFALLFLTFLVCSLYYTEGVLDAGANEPVDTWLFPFWGSSVEVDPRDGIGIAISPGPLVLVVPLLLGAWVARPWRSLRQPRSA